MDIFHVNQQFGISLQKLRKMEKAGVLRVSQSTLPDYWQKVIDNFRKGKLTARTVALAHNFPEKFELLVKPSPENRRLLKANLLEAGITVRKTPKPDPEHAIARIVSNVYEGGDPSDLIEILKNIIPNRPVSYAYVAINLLVTESEEIWVNFIDRYLRNALLLAREHEAMTGWWHKEICPEGKSRTIYHSPDGRYDL